MPSAVNSPDSLTTLQPEQPVAQSEQSPAVPEAPVTVEEVVAHADSAVAIAAEEAGETTQRMRVAGEAVAAVVDSAGRAEVATATNEATTKVTGLLGALKAGTQAFIAGLRGQPNPNELAAEQFQPVNEAIAQQQQFDSQLQDAKAAIEAQRAGIDTLRAQNSQLVLENERLKAKIASMEKKKVVDYKFPNSLEETTNQQMNMLAKAALESYKNRPNKSGYASLGDLENSTFTFDDPENNRRQYKVDMTKVKDPYFKKAFMHLVEEEARKDALPLRTSPEAIPTENEKLGNVFQSLLFDEIQTFTQEKFSSETMLDRVNEITIEEIKRQLGLSEEDAVLLADVIQIKACILGYARLSKDPALDALAAKLDAGIALDPRLSLDTLNLTDSLSKVTEGISTLAGYSDELNGDYETAANKIFERYKESIIQLQLNGVDVRACLPNYKRMSRDVPVPEAVPAEPIPVPEVPPVTPLAESPQTPA